MNSKFFLFNSIKPNKKNIIYLTIILLLSFVFVLPLCFSNVYATPDKVKVTTNSTKIYAEASVESSVLGEAKYGDVFDVVGIDSRFYKIEYNQATGYILSAYSVDATLNDIKLYLDTNAVVVKDTTLFEYSNNNFVKNNITLSKDTRVKLLSKDESTNLSKISFEKDNQILTYYVNSEDINTDGISKKTVIAFMLIVSGVTLFWIFYSFFKGKN